MHRTCRYVGPRTLKPPEPGHSQNCWFRVPVTEYSSASSASCCRSAAAPSAVGGTLTFSSVAVWSGGGLRNF